MLRIQILGIGCKKSRALKANLLAALRSLGMDASIEEIERVEDIIQYQILSTPALLINQNIISEGNVLEVNELKPVLEYWNHQLPSIKKILVPTDFSDVAAGAFRFALDLAQQLSSEITLLHVYHPFFDPNNPLAGKERSEAESLARKRLDIFLGENISPANKAEKLGLNEKIKKEWCMGFAGEEIMARSKQFDLIVMGTTGDGDWLEQLFGSVSSSVAREAHCPVLLVPKNVQFKGFNTVVYAHDNETSDRVLIEQVVDEMRIPTDAVHLVHVEKNSFEEYLLRNGRYEHLPRLQKPSIRLTLADIASKSILKAINEYADSHHADLIIVNTVQRSFLENLFHRSFTKQMILQTSIPLLILHSNPQRIQNLSPTEVKNAKFRS
ncbi:MAG: MTH895/ArsE family thioredoxin-like protein [Saprospiraceae bacterium]|nr:MTH895/ArsE family thioredoxin-like protein [Saprospiraceae bacterium]